jgi:hypothetical protein
VLRVEQLEDRCLLSANFILQWNGLLLNVQQLRGQGNQQAARALAMMGAAVYDSVNAIDPTHTVYHVDARAFPNVATASADAAAAQAAHDVAYALYTQAADRALFDGLLATQLTEVPNDQAETDGIALGQYVAAQILAWRANDGSSATVPYVYGSGPGVYQATPPNVQTAMPATPQWPFVTPFALNEGDQFRPGPPPELTSAAYTTAFNEVKSLGSIDSTTRTPEQTEIAFFWAGVGVSNAGVGIWNQITQTVAAQHHLSLPDTSRLFAEVSVANADAFIAGFDAKYTYNFWRPVTAIRAADTDGNPETVQDPTWTPLIVTPFHPSYVSLHADQSRAAAEALTAFFGTDHVPFSATWAGVTRSFNKFTDAAKEAGMSRIYAGIHWSFDKAAGEQLGRKIGQYVADNFFQPLTGSGGQNLVAVTAAPAPVNVSRHANQVQPLAEALARLQAGRADTPTLHGIDVRIADVGDLTHGKADDVVLERTADATPAQGTDWVGATSALFAWDTDAPWIEDGFAGHSDKTS